MIKKFIFKGEIVLMKKLVIGLCVLGLSSWTLAQQNSLPILDSQLPGPNAKPVLNQPQAMVIPSAPTVAAKSWILVDAATSNIIAEHNADAPMYPASLTKMMTSYLAIDAIEAGKIAEEDLVTISVKAWRMANSTGSASFIREGTQVSVIDLLRGVIIQSGNDASVALAEYVAGNEDGFVDLMNKKALELGMANTRYANSHGLDDDLAPDQLYTTAKDQAILARAIIYDHARHYPIYAEKNFTYNNIRQGNRNLLLYRDDTVDGLKTGHTSKAGYNLVASAKRDGMRLISVVLGTESEKVRAAETEKLLAYGFRYFQTVNLYKAGQEMAIQPVWAGKTDQVTIGLPKDITLTLPKGSEAFLKASMHINEIIKAPITQGQELGNLTVQLNDQLIVNTPLVATHAVEEAGFFARLWDNIKLFFKNLFS
jgi:serine-type D-Ala-D-Ala carboxypeptidase (penicillin-binding protein 5/6)